ncbi:MULTISPECIES: esterase/lipase family protein [unclassified Modestobacter]|uniref:esterase/lipase family protein n=1 Tax=unclassified Modestobacter TaxID=2643866 RepID=UPI0022AABB30|nr:MULTISPECIES: alpha/beta fold hydrolase [unclassified Modestobacter]MCZ2812815.1 alpha/beta fold hydrolase [Modestobacter sp. VKM Ac-2979]MCZ2843156.1 alpha/beta fold hydrolase [Modestobacter sp. VKM Ac-2980]MCZ2847763.1 alpha/beta fold hydrolase [Modestobacter sp. VKM Ac-2978]
MTTVALSLALGAFLGGAPVAVAAPAVTVAAPAVTVTGVLDVPPPGANDWSCRPSAAHPYPVVLVPGTFESMAKNWSTLSPVLKAAGYCVYSLNYGVTNGVPATGPIAESAEELAVFVDRVLKATKAKQVDLVGHSQGGMMPRHYLAFLKGARHVHALVGIAPSNHGTQGLVFPESGLGSSGDNVLCAACTDQQAGSPFLTTLNSGGDTVAGPYYTVISTVYDEVVTPYTSQALDGAPQQVTNIVLQDKCPLDPIEHDQAPNDPVVHQWVLEALSQRTGPADPDFEPACA